MRVTGTVVAGIKLPPHNITWLQISLWRIYCRPPCLAFQICRFGTNATMTMEAVVPFEASWKGSQLFYMWAEPLQTTFLMLSPGDSQSEELKSECCSQHQMNQSACHIASTSLAHFYFWTFCYGNKHWSIILPSDLASLHSWLFHRFSPWYLQVELKPCGAAASQYTHYCDKQSTVVVSLQTRSLPVFQNKVVLSSKCTESEPKLNQRGGVVTIKSTVLLQFIMN